MSGTSSREVDMAVLTLCDHTVISAGSFGWWAAYLRGAAGNFRSPLSSVVRTPPPPLHRSPNAGEQTQELQKSAVCTNRRAPGAIGDLIRIEEDRQPRHKLANSPACIAKSLADMRLKRRYYCVLICIMILVFTIACCLLLCKLQLSHTNCSLRTLRDPSRAPSHDGFTFYYASLAAPGSEYYRMYIERSHEYFPHDWVPLDDAAIERLLGAGSP